MSQAKRRALLVLGMMLLPPLLIRNGDPSGGDQDPPAFAPAELKSRLAVLAADSLAGRAVGTSELDRAAAIVSRELEQSGVRSAGDRETYFQRVELFVSRIDVAQAVVRRDSSRSKSPVRENGERYRPYIDFVPLPDLERPNSARHVLVRGRWVAYAGRLGAPNVLAPALTAGLIVVFDAPRRNDGTPDYQRQRWAPLVAPYRAAAAILLTTLDVTPPGALSDEMRPRFRFRRAAFADTATFPPIAAVSQGMARTLLANRTDAGVDLNYRTAATIRFDVAVSRVRTGASNIVAVIPGSDPSLRNEHVIVVAHLDHLSPGKRVPGADTIFNGADDNASGAVALVELARHFASLRIKPKRSLIFLWTTGAEEGLLGSEWFAQHPTVPLKSIVGVVNLDMIGRGGAADIAGGGPDYLEAVGSRRLSSDLAALIDSVNSHSPYRFALNHRLDAHGDSVAYVCSGDHWSFARRGVPSVWFTTGRHADYHMPSDETDHVDFDKLARITGFVASVVADLAERPTRPAVDQRASVSAATCER